MLMTQPVEKSVFKEKARGHILRDKSHTEAKHEQPRRGSTPKSNTSNGQKKKVNVRKKITVSDWKIDRESGDGQLQRLEK